MYIRTYTYIYIYICTFVFSRRDSESRVSEQDSKRERLRLVDFTAVPGACSRRQKVPATSNQAKKNRNSINHPRSFFSTSWIFQSVRPKSEAAAMCFQNDMAAMTDAENQAQARSSSFFPTLGLGAPNSPKWVILIYVRPQSRYQLHTWIPRTRVLSWALGMGLRLKLRDLRYGPLPCMWLIVARFYRSTIRGSYQG